MKRHIDFFRGFVQFVRKPSEKDKLEVLEQKLTHIFRICLELAPKEGRTPKTKNNYQVIREIISKNFPELGYYNDVLDLKEKIGETELTVGDAVDDLSDIVKDIEESLDLEREMDVLANIKLSFELHFKGHLINLLKYLNYE